MATVLRAFDYSFDGVTALKAAPGDEIDFRDMTAGLAAEGYVLEVAPPADDVAPPAPEPEAPVQSPSEPEAPQGEPVAAIAAEQPVDLTAEPAAEPDAEPAPKPRKRR